MSQRSQEEQRLLEKAARYLPGGSLGNVYSDPEHAFLIRGGKGSRVYDLSGNQYIDYLLGSGPMILGHAHPTVVQAVQETVERGSTFFATNDTAVELAEEIVQAVPCAEMVRFTTSGTDATFQCLRVARAYRRRDKVLKFEGGYHGTHDYALMSVNPPEPPPFPQSVPASAGIPRAIQELVLVAPFNDLETTTAVIEQHHEELAAVIVEPLQRVLAPRPGFLQGLRELTTHYGIPLVFDEVVTGFRLAYGGAQEFYGVVPDLAALGKTVGGGFPLGAVCGRAELLRAYDPASQETDSFVPQIGTLNGNPVAAAAGLATLRELKKEGVYQHIHQMGSRLRENLERLLREAELPAQVSGEDPCFDVLFTDTPITDYRSTLSHDKTQAKRFHTLLLREGVLKSEQKFYLGLCHTPQDIEETVQALTRVVEQLQG
ncbi:MAG: aspartate aminotransferase family protein [Dehalococcoidia bacterium]